MIFSLIETAKENGLDPYRYLVYIMSNAPVLTEADDDWAAKLLPEWAPERCRTYLSCV
ncbi:transposase domain-containing protein [Flavonifractor plautii]|uniref:transposase domain-containing protein n=1 Tax=Flavonifractor plautii TaxID=292800 RepID=UPI0009E8ECF9|nr:transposase domain-containing protein [Flavonifractor plautii]MCB5376319.1 transposase domain-containing protein [Flavonifractor plautii]MCI7153710.1 transposase domain-containing protein [Flavonifractor plautii]MDU3014418.1 transposase domain-containing protein [Flavonifractor plautii]MDU6203103.1 transposase domain-containing protein [Flavonifractor plautii]MDU6292481.1 transposase domain-containing protein [Flavonifractor plautii]